MLHFIEEFLFWFVLLPILAIIIFLGGLFFLDYCASLQNSKNELTRQVVRGTFQL
jgi:uncharacterized membrane protein